MAAGLHIPQSSVIFAQSIRPVWVAGDGEFVLEDRDASRSLVYSQEYAYFRIVNGRRTVPRETTIWAYATNGGAPPNSPLYLDYDNGTNTYTEVEFPTIDSGIGNLYTVYKVTVSDFVSSGGQNGGADFRIANPSVSTGGPWQIYRVVAYDSGQHFSCVFDAAPGGGLWGQPPNASLIDNLIAQYLGSTALSGNAGGQLVSTVATGMAPLVIASTTQVNNLNSELWGNRKAPFSAVAYEVPVGTSATTITSVTPTQEAATTVSVYYRVTAATTLGISITYSDASGAQTLDLLSPGTSVAVGSYTLVPQFISATTSSAVVVSATAGAASSVYVSALILGVV